jgi:beta-lactam-binding protein with PASTA domain
MLVLTVILIFMLKYWLGCSTNHGQKIPVPNLSKMSLLKVKDTLNKLHLNYIVQDTASFNPKYPPLSVVEQDPEFGEFVKENRKIYLTLNRNGFRDVMVPDLYGKTKRHAESELRSRGFRIGTFSYVPDRGRNVVRGLTYKGKKIKAGEKIPKNSKINLIVGDGKGQVKIDTTKQVN